MFASPSFVRTAASIIALVSLIGCRSMKNPPAVESAALPAQSTALAAEAFAGAQSDDPDLAAYMPKEEQASNSVDEYRPQTRSFGGSTSSGYSAGGDSAPGCQGGCCH
mgnify:CR=1 FL=1